MTGKATFRLFVFVCLVGLFVWVVRREKAVDPGPAAVMVGMRSDRVSEVRLRMLETDITCRKVGRAWNLVRPVSTRANAAFIERLLVVLEELPRLETVGVDDMQHRSLTLSDYELEQPRVIVELIQDDRKWGLHVGTESPLGDVVYVKLADEDAVIATSTNLFGALPGDASEMRDRGLFQREPGQVERLELERAGQGFVRIVKTDGRWVLRQPVDVRADGQRVARLLDKLYMLRALSFVWDPPAGEPAAEPEIYGTRPDQATMQVRIWHKGKETPSEVVIGKAIEDWSGYYVGARDLQSIVAVTSIVVDAVVQVTVDSLRARRILTTDAEQVTAIHIEENDRRLSLRRDGKVPWQINEPVQWPADGENVHRFLSTLTSIQAESFHGGTNLSAYGLAPAPCAIELITAANAASAPLGAAPRGQRLLVGSTVTQDVTYVKLESGETIFGIASKKIDELWPGRPDSRDRSRVDPLLFRDRAMLALNPESVRGLSLVKEGVQQNVQKPAEGPWRAADASRSTVVEDAVMDILIAVARLRALRIEAHNETNLVRFGLDEPAITLTVALDASEGIQRIIMIGFRARTDGVYAMVQGQDLVFVLENRVAAALMRDIVRPLEPKPEDKGR